MSIKLINFGKHKFEIQSCGALYWRSQDILIVSDLHFEKSSYFAKKGSFLPPYDSIETLKTLKKICDQLNPKTILFLGDVFHDGDGKNRIMGQAKTIFDTLLSQFEIIWIDGNHDKGNAPDGINVLTDKIIDGISFTHISKQNDGFEISGHYHPCTSFKHKGHRVRRACFIHDDHKLIMPSYGSLTGGFNITDPTIKNIISNPIITIVH